MLAANHGRQSWPKIARQPNAGHKKTPPPGGSGVSLIMTRKEELLCPWQAWL
jgi:hypothetical protein